MGSLFEALIIQGFFYVLFLYKVYRSVTYHFPFLFENLQKENISNFYLQKIEQIDSSYSIIKCRRNIIIDLPITPILICIEKEKLLDFSFFLFLNILGCFFVVKTFILHA